ncbi:MAG TPA: kelch repeat-containing protein, partial [Planctomycetota bacterium]|nr:kelch repeat-containing protein [Planctomycetota bacterium]
MSTPRPHATGRRRQSARRAIAFLLFLGASMARPDDAKTEDVASVPGTVLPEGIASFGAAAADGWLYIYGGHVGRTHSHSIDNLSRSFRRVDLLTQTIWEDLPARVPAQSPALVALDGRVYRIGGLTAKNRIGEDEDLESLAVFERYDPISRRWEELPPLPEPRSSHDAAVLDGKIFVAGGWTLSSSEKTWLETAWKIDPNAARPKWEAVPGPRVPRRAAALASAHGKLWLFGGMTRDGELSKAVEVYDPESKTWTDGPEILGPGFGVAAIGARDALFVSGMDGKVLRLDLEKNAWIEAGALVFPRFFHRLVATPAGDLLAVGGAARGGHLRVTETLRFGAQSRSPSVSRFTLPFPGEAKSRQGIFLHGTTLFVAGGNNSLG